MKCFIPLKRFFLLLVFSFLATILFAKDVQEFPKPMQPYRLVNDFANILSSSERETIEQKLLRFNDTTSTQIYVVTVNTLFGYDKSDYALRLAEKWGIGQKGKDNGILLLIKDKTKDQRGEVFIAVGYGLESVIPDVIAKRIVEQEFLRIMNKEADYSKAINATVEVLMSLSSKEFSAKEYIAKYTEEMPIAYRIFANLFFLAIIIMLFFKKSRILLSKILMFVIYLLLASRNAGFSSNGSSSGGFGGGGGGSFGGGGAGGSW